MARHRSFRIVTAWIATIAILMAALMPSVSHALAANSQGVSWAEICSTAGIKIVQVGSKDSPASTMPGKMAMHGEHCPFCSLHAGAMGMPPSHKFPLPVAPPVVNLPALFYQTPTLQFIWSAAQSRAPPAIS